MKQEIQSSNETVWNDVESNSKPVSDDDALLSATGKVGELKRYGCSVAKACADVLTIHF